MTFTFLSALGYFANVKIKEGTQYQLTYKAVLRYIAKFNEETDRRLRAAFPENVWVRRTAWFADLRRKELYPYCEHPELSLAHFGSPHHSLKVPDHVEAISNERIREFLNLIILSYDFYARRHSQKLFSRESNSGRH